MKIIIVKETIHSEKKNEDFYLVRFALVDEKGSIIRKAKEPIMWLTKEQYENVKF